MRHSMQLGIVLILTLSPRAAAQFAISPDGKLTATGLGNNIKVEDVATQKEILRIAGHSQPVTSLVFTPNSRLLISGSLDQSVKIWDVTTGRLLRSIRLDAPVTNVNSNGKTVTVIDDKKNKREFDIESGKEVKTGCSTSMQRKQE